MSMIAFLGMLTAFFTGHPGVGLLLFVVTLLAASWEMKP